MIFFALLRMYSATLASADITTQYRPVRLVLPIDGIKQKSRNTKQNTKKYGLATQFYYHGNKAAGRSSLIKFVCATYLSAKYFARTLVFSRLAIFSLS